jgi:hypothetical protein
MVNEVTPPTRKGKMASETAATGLAGLHTQPRIRRTDRRESWIPYPTLPDSGETEGTTMDCEEFSAVTTSCETKAVIRYYPTKMGLRFPMILKMMLVISIVLLPMRTA